MLYAERQKTLLLPYKEPILTTFFYADLFQIISVVLSKILECYLKIYIPWKFVTSTCNEFSSIITLFSKAQTFQNTSVVVLLCGSPQREIYCTSPDSEMNIQQHRTIAKMDMYGKATGTFTK